MDRTCPSCGAANPEEARFCMSCGAPLAEPAAEERRQVTIVFADLVGFTERSDEADPEDVRRALVPFHRAAKTAIEEHGGTLDKFIGDAAMGVFGAPVAHGDDPARAVRAGLALLDRVEEIRAVIDPDATIRVAVHTGDAIVSFGAGPQIGEAVAGDVVNTASRMQSLAPPGRLVVGPRTWEAVRERFDGEPMDPVRVKGKAEPLRCWLIGDERAPGDAAPFVGRDDDLAALERMVADVRASGAASAITIVASPGLGKTRLVAALDERLSRDPSLTRYAIAFSPRGDDSAFGPFADLIADVAGIGRHADPATVEEGIERLTEGCTDDERPGLARRLRTVLGTGTTAGTPEGPHDVADAIARIMAARAEAALLVIEDVHWADPAARAVLDALPDALGRAPVAIVCTSRPEALAVGGTVGPIRTLAPLSDEATRMLLRAAAPVDLPEDRASAIAARAEGNPLFAIEFGRTLEDQGESGTVPTTIRAVIAARLDALPGAHRDLIVDAAVVGTTFWPAALEAIRPGRGIAEGLAELERRALVRPLATSRLAGETAYGFTHALIRDEAYGRLARAERARRHLAVGDWLEERAGAAGPTFAAALARHFDEAAAAATSAGERATAAAATPRAIAWLVTAGEQIFRIDGEGAFTMFERALELGATGELGERALYGSAVVGRRIGALPGPVVLERYRDAHASARARGDLQAEGMQLVRIGSQLAAMGESERALEAYDEAIEMLQPLSPERPLAAALMYRAEEDMFTGRSADSLARVERALPIARDTGHEDLVVMGLHLRGDARCSMGDLGGVDDLEEALVIARRSAGEAEIATSLTYVGEWRWQLDGPLAGKEVFEESVRVTSRGRVVSQGTWARAHLMLVSIELGEWDRALELVGQNLSIEADKLDATLDVVSRTTRSAVLLRRGDLDALDDPEKIVALAEGTHDLQAQAPALGYAAEHAIAFDDPAGARHALERLDRITTGADTIYRATEATRVARLAATIDEPDLARRLLAPLDDLPSRRERLYVDAARAVLAEADGADAAAAYADVAERWRTFPCPWEEAHARQGLARVTGATAERDRAAELFARLGVPG